MSTKIYDAYVVEGMTIGQLFRHLCEFRRAYIRGCTDFLASVLKKGVKHDFSKVSEFLLSTMRKHYNSPFNFESSVLVVPYRGKLYVKFFCDWHVFTSDEMKKLVNNKHFKDFHYQNQADRPEDIPASEWTKRRKTWDAIEKAGGPGITFTDMGLVFRLVDENVIFGIVHGAILKVRGVKL